LYLVVANALLRTRVLRDAISSSSAQFAVSGGSSALLLDYESAYSLLPGRVHVEGLTIRGRDRAVEWRLTLDQADVAISLVALLDRTFRATSVRSSGFTIRARLRLERAKATPEVVAALPPIVGFADPPLVDEGLAAPPLTDANYRLWSVDLLDVDVKKVREVWIHTVRAQGDTRVRGRAFFRPQRQLDVSRATLDANGVDFSYGSQPLARGVRGSFTATVHRVDLQKVDGLAILDQVSYDGRLRGVAIVDSALGLLAPRSNVIFTNFEAPFDARIVLNYGKFAAGTRMTTEAAGARLATEELAGDAVVESEFRIDGDLATITARASALRVFRLGAEQARVASIEATLTGHQRRLTRLLDDAHFNLDIRRAETSNVALWKRFSHRRQLGSSAREWLPPTVMPTARSPTGAVVPR
jgi:hypothetical protein